MQKWDIQKHIIMSGICKSDDICIWLGPLKRPWNIIKSGCYVHMAVECILAVRCIPISCIKPMVVRCKTQVSTEANIPV